MIQNFENMFITIIQPDICCCFFKVGRGKGAFGLMLTRPTLLCCCFFNYYLFLFLVN